jgi:hypothetical protein
MEKDVPSSLASFGSVNRFYEEPNHERAPGWPSRWGTLPPLPSQMEVRHRSETTGAVVFSFVFLWCAP